MYIWFITEKVLQRNLKASNCAVQIFLTWDSLHDEVNPDEVGDVNGGSEQVMQQVKAPHLQRRLVQLKWLIQDF